MSSPNSHSGSRIAIIDDTSSTRGSFSSSDTDNSDAFSIASSGLTTPDDEETHLSFDCFKETSQDLHNHKTPKSYSDLGKPCIANYHSPTRGRSLSATVQNAKRVARSLLVFRRKQKNLRGTHEPRMNESLGTKHDAFYMFPNQHISDFEIMQEVHDQTQETSHESYSSRSPILQNTPLISGPLSESTQTYISTLISPKFALAAITKLVLFIPWCIAVGATAVLYPTKMEFVAFAPGYVSSPKGLRRFAHWANTASYHLMIFLSVVIFFIWSYPFLGVPLGGMMVARASYVWGNFRLDKTIPLGEDDQQSIYLVIREANLEESCVVVTGYSDYYNTVIYSAEDEHL